MAGKRLRGMRLQLHSWWKIIYGIIRQAINRSLNEKIKKITEYIPWANGI